MKGLHTIARGQVVYGRLGPLGLFLFNFERISNADWDDFMRSAHAINAGDYPEGSLVHFIGATPNSEQRRMGYEFIHAEQIPEQRRIALLASSRLERSAMNVFSWFQHRVQLRALAPADHRAAIAWVREGIDFDEAEAVELWQGAYQRFGLEPPGGASSSSARGGR